MVAVPIEFTPMQTRPIVEGAIFLSASIPDPARWKGRFDALEITDAVVALARAVLTSGYRLVSAAHPTIAPLLLYVAAEFPDADSLRVQIYQSMLFEDVLPTETRRFEADRVGSVTWTPAADGDEPTPGRWNESLRLMREQMLTETEPAAACFLGGMDGIPTEFAMYTGLFPSRPIYALGRPGGEAAELVDRVRSPLRPRLRTGGTYPALWRKVMEEIEQSR